MADAHPPGCYYVNAGSSVTDPLGTAGTGTIQRQCNPLLAEALKAAGWNGPFATFAEAKAFASQHVSPVQKGSQVAQSGLSGVEAIGNFFARLTEANTWVRVGEVVAGVLVLYVGLKALVSPPGQQIAKRTAKQTVRKVVEKTTPAGRAEHAARAVAGRKR